MLNIYHGNDNVFELAGLKNNDGNFMNGATVTAKILNMQSAEVVAAGYSAQTIPYVPASSGDYRKVVDKGITDNIPSGQYQVEWTAEEGGADFRRVDFVEIGKRQS